MNRLVLEKERGFIFQELRGYKKMPGKVFMFKTRRQHTLIDL